jgi:hypothetical protein
VQRDEQLRKQAEQLRQEADLAFALINNTPSEIRSCVWRGSHDNWTLDKAKVKISMCQRAIAQSILLRLVAWIVGILLLALAIGFRAKIASGLYNLFIGCLTLRLRFNRSRKRFLDNARKEAENRLG